MKKTSNKKQMAIEFACAVIWIVLAVNGFAQKKTLAWLYLVCAVTFIVCGIIYLVRYLREKKEGHDE